MRSTGPESAGGTEQPCPPEIAIVRVARIPDEVSACWPVLAELRPNLATPAALVEAWRAQVQEGYTMAYAVGDRAVVGAIGYRVMRTLAWGRNLYIDDLTVDPAHRGRGFATALMEHAVSRARDEGCDEVHLDSGYARHAAHRFYLRHGFTLRCHHLSLGLRSE